MLSFRDPLLWMDAVSFASDGLQVNMGSDDAPKLSTMWMTQKFRGRCGDKHVYFSETFVLTLVEAVVARAARLAEGEDIVVVAF